MTILSMSRILLAATLVALFLSVPAVLSAQVDESTPESPLEEGDDLYYAIGLQASLLSGAGLSGRMVIQDRYTIQLSTFIIALSSLTHFNVGVEGQYAFTKGSVGRLYGLLGSGYYLTTKSDTTKPGNRIAEPFRVGLGVGGDLLVSKNFAFDGSLAFHWFTATGKVLPLPSVGFHYYFR